MRNSENPPLNVRWSEPGSEKQVVRRASEAVQALEETRRANGADPKRRATGYLSLSKRQGKGGGARQVPDETTTAWS